MPRGARPRASRRDGDPVTFVSSGAGRRRREPQRRARAAEAAACSGRRGGWRRVAGWRSAQV